MAIVTLRPTGTVYYGYGFYNFGDYKPSYIGDNNNNTYTKINTPISGYGDSYCQLQSFNIPTGAVITSVKFCVYGKRTDSSSNCGYAFNLVAAEDTSASETGKTKIFTSNIVPSLVPYYSSGAALRTATQAVTASESQMFLSSAYPMLFITSKGPIEFHEVYVEVTYEMSNKIFVGGIAVSDIYVGSQKATAVYLGSTKIL